MSERGRHDKKSLRTFVREHRTELDEIIRRVVPNIGAKLDEDERELWVLNNEDLYNWARREGVNV